MVIIGLKTGENQNKVGGKTKRPILNPYNTRLSFYVLAREINPYLTKLW
jgi:hypothetical protein